MKKVVFAGFLICILIVVGIPYSYGQSTCPYQVNYQDSYPGCTNSWGFYLISLEPIPAGPITLNFPSNSNPGCNQTFNNTGYPYCSSTGTYYAFDNIAPVCSGFLGTGTITLSDGKVCHYENGLQVDYAECLDFVENCKQPLIEFAQDFIQAAPNCKLWEGPCATESEIWRSGDVNIGSVASLDGYKLGVKGGIVTEMLQICKPEWCDYVFDDSFNLKSLTEVSDFILSNGHLPDCTPAHKIITEGGFLLDKETVQQQQKIEEIFLYLIAAQKRLSHVENSKVLRSQPSPNPTGISEFSGVEYAANMPEILTQIECFQIKPAPNGIAGISISNANGPFNLMWHGPVNGSINNVPCINGAIQIPNLAAGQYTVIVSNASGVLGNCSFSISTGTSSANCDVFSNPACRQAILNMLEDEAFGSPSDCIQWEGDPCSYEKSISRSGNVCIGTSIGRAGFSLAVKGGIVSDKVRIELCESHGWCDYVFDEEYPLLSLPEIESYVKTHSHLPGTISQEKVTENGGIEMREVKLDHQVKIEEAYLHLIELNKTKEALKARINALTENN